MRKNNSVATLLLHWASSLLTRQGARHLQQSSTRVEAQQRDKLNQVLQLVANTESGKQFNLRSGMSVEAFQRAVPLTEYSDWRELIEQQQSSGKPLLTSEVCERYQPTSGSTSKIKWIPYTPSFLDDLDQAINPWMADLYANFPGLKRGRHYWSLSWVPSDLREQTDSSINDDLQLLPWWKRLFMSRIMAVPQSVSLASTSEESFFATACYLAACTELSLISVWSPTFALSILDLLKEQHEAVAEVLRTGRWTANYAGLSYLEAPKNLKVASYLESWDGVISPEFTQTLWPQLALISAWDTSSSTQWAEKLKSIFPHSGFQGKGLWATEGVVTIPLQSEFPLAINSHFYEFEDLETGDILTAWQLQAGQRVRPIITTSNGLLRYATKDQVRVTGFINQCPCLEFISRIDGTDMVGEKMSPEIAVELMQTFSADSSLTAVSLLACQASEGEAGKPHYELLCSGPVLSDQQLSEFNQQLESKLLQNFHYNLARELGQLDAARLTIVPDAMAVYTEQKVARGMVAGNIKVEPLTMWQGEPLSSQLKQALSA